jgi:hypothetical protein
LVIVGARRFISREHGGVANSGTTLAAMQQDEAGGEMQLLAHARRVGRGAARLDQRGVALRRAIG